MLNIEQKMKEIKVLFKVALDSVQGLDFQNTLRVVESYQEFLQFYIELQKDIQRIQNSVTTMQTDNADDFEPLRIEYKKTFEKMESIVAKITADLLHFKKRVA